MEHKHTKGSPAHKRQGLLQGKNKLELDIPRNKNADISREISLRNTIFTRTRILVLALVLVIALSITGTLAYITWTSNQTPNRETTGEIELHIVENIGGTTKTDTDSTFTLGKDTKKVSIKAGTDANRAPEKVRVTFVPEVQDSTLSAAVAFSEANASGSWGPIETDANNNKYIKTDLIYLYINPAYADYWTYDNDGTFVSTNTLKAGEQTPDLLYGATFADGVDASDYGKVTVNVIADAIQEGATGAW